MTRFVNINDVLVGKTVWTSLDNIVGVAQTGKYTTVTLKYSVVYDADTSEARRTNVLTVDQNADTFMAHLLETPTGFAEKASEPSSRPRARDIVNSSDGKDAVVGAFPEPGSVSLDRTGVRSDDGLVEKMRRGIESGGHMPGEISRDDIAAFLRDKGFVDTQKRIDQVIDVVRRHAHDPAFSDEELAVIMRATAWKGIKKTTPSDSTGMMKPSDPGVGLNPIWGESLSGKWIENQGIHSVRGLMEQAKMGKRDR